MIFRSTFLMMAILGFALLFSACQQDSLTEDIQLEMVQDADDALSLRCPNILAEVERLSCCNRTKRRVKITLDNITYLNYCGGGCGDELVYKFYRYDNPNAAPIVKISDLAAPVFCLPLRHYAMLISDNGVPELLHNGSGFYVPINPGGKASPIYDVDLSGSCFSTPTLPPDRPPFPISEMP